MLLYKSWLETRSRFLWGSSLIIANISHTVLTAPGVMRSIHEQLPWEQVSFTRYLWMDVYAGSLLAAWTGLAVVLAAGGLRHEQSSGVSAFTLSLPARRSRFLLAQVAVGWAEVLVLGTFPALLIPVLSSLVGQAFPFREALQHALLLVGAGSVLFGWALLISQKTQGEFAGLAISLSSIGAFFVLVKKIHMLDRFDIFDIMTGADLLDRQTYLLHGPIPWLSLGTTMAILLGMVWLSILVIERHDF